MQAQVDAVVFCNCFEKGRLREPPPVGCRLTVAADGALLCGSDDLYVQTAFANWLHDRACDHEYGRLLSRPIGDIAEIATLRTILQQVAGRYSMILSRVVYHGSHNGTFIPPRELPALRAEVMSLADIHCEDRDMEKRMRVFESCMSELVECAMFANKPIAF